MPRECQLFREVLQLHARHRGAQPALLGLGGPFTYQQLLDEVEQRQAWLSAQPSGTFALALENGPEALFWDLAALFAARPIVILPAFFSSAQRRHCLAQSGAVLALADEAFADDLHASGFIAGERFWSRQPPAAVPLPPGTAKITYTSGSTGAPKGVCLSADAMLRVAR